jgi:hydroxyacylglutathione hydrolase
MMRKILQRGSRRVGISVHQFICLSDNFGLLVHDEETGATASIDAPDGDAIAAEAARLGWRLTHLLLTHHHLDHVQGTARLKARYPGLIIVGARRDAHRLPGLELQVGEGDVVHLGAARAKVIEAPGHTSGHIVYHFEEGEAAFVGDTLFSLGCGRVFEGTMEEMYYTLEKLAALPPETRVYCGHEYTQANAKFALTVDPSNPLLIERAREADELLRAGKATPPTTIALENATNPFLRVDDPDIRRTMGLADADAVAVFAQMRERKNVFVG